MTDDELSVVAREIISEVHAFSEAVRQLEKRIEKSDKHVDYRIRQTRKAVHLAWGAIGLVVGAIGGLGWVAYDQYSTRERVLCPLYSVFVRSYNPDGPAARSAGIEAYNAQFVQLRAQYRELGCNFVEPFVLDPATGRFVPRPPNGPS